MKGTLAFITVLLFMPLSFGAAPADIYPLQKGTQWTYITQDGVEKTTQVESFTQFRVEESVVAAAILKRTDGRDRLILRTDQQWIECGLIDPDQGTVDCEHPLIFFQWPLEKGTRWQGADLDFVVERKESITVPAGTFETAWRIAYAPTGGLDPVGQVWVVKGIGPVRILERDADYRLLKFESGTGPDLAPVPEAAVAGVLRNLPSTETAQGPHVVLQAYQYVSRIGWAWWVALALLGLCVITAYTLILALRRQEEDKAKPATTKEVEEVPMVAAMIRTGMLDQASDDLEQLIQKNPQYPDLHYQLAQVQKGNEEWDQAQKSLEKALSLNPDYVEARLDLGRVLMTKGEAGKASEQFKWAAEKNPSFADLHLELGKSLVRLGNQKEAREAFERALEINPHLDEARQELKGCRESAQKSD